MRRVKSRRNKWIDSRNSDSEEMAYGKRMNREVRGDRGKKINDQIASADKKTLEETIQTQHLTRDGRENDKSSCVHSLRAER